jgi:hypothetical protein
MNANSVYYIGHEHTICEDYALAEINPWQNLAYAIVCDGCSASPDVDFGARILALSAKRTLRFDCKYKYTSEKFGEVTIQNATRVYDIFPSLHPQALDATLLAAWVYNNNLTVYMYGDGVLIHKTKTDIKSIHIQLTSGAPDYLSYSLDAGRMAAYKAMKDNKKEVVTRVNDVVMTEIYEPFYPFIYTCPVEEGDVIAVISDGINSFRKADYTPIPWQDLVVEFTGFKTTEGEFVSRRISAFKRKCLKEGITFSDDISIASIIV